MHALFEYPYHLFYKVDLIIYKFTILYSIYIYIYIYNMSYHSNSSLCRASRGPTAIDDDTPHT